MAGPFSARDAIPDCCLRHRVQISQVGDCRPSLHELMFVQTAVTMALSHHSRFSQLRLEQRTAVNQRSQVSDLILGSQPTRRCFHSSKSTTVASPAVASSMSITDCGSGSSGGFGSARGHCDLRCDVTLHVVEHVLVPVQHGPLAPAHEVHHDTGIDAERQHHCG